MESVRAQGKRRGRKESAVTQQRGRHPLWALLGQVGWPVLLGLAACTLFYGALHQGWLGSQFVHRYTAAHPILYCEVALFFVGLAALGLKAVQVLGQLVTTRLISFDIPPGQTIPIGHCSEMLAELDEISHSARQSFLGRRLRDALAFLQRSGSAEGLGDELKYLAEMEEVRQSDSYALVRIVIWATPMLGFLGTVVGITQALGDLDPKMLATAIETAMQGLLAGLYVAFDTTALALSLSMVLMFIQFFVERVESQLLSIVDARAGEELMGRFEVQGTSSDPQVATIQRMAREVIQANDRLVARQSEIWQASMEAANEKWSQAARDATGQIRDGLGQALDHSLTTFAQRLAQVEDTAANQVQERWEQWQTALSSNARLMQTQQQEISRQSELMARVVEATGDVLKLETALNQNLKSLAGAKNFEDTVMSLAAAIHLLNMRLGGSDADARHIDLGQTRAQGRAA